MKDATNAARLERVVAALEIVVGRLERLTGPFEPGAAYHQDSSQPPSPHDGQKEADEYIKERIEQIREERRLALDEQLRHLNEGP